MKLCLFSRILSSVRDLLELNDLPSRSPWVLTLLFRWEYSNFLKAGLIAKTDPKMTESLLAIKVRRSIRISERG